MRESATIRPKRQITLPRDICEALDVKPGDRLLLEVENGVLLVRSQKRRALDALRAIQDALAETGISEEELLEGGRRVRDELFAEKYAPLLQEWRGQKPRARRRGSA